jgi:hypothetical protein
MLYHALAAFSFCHFITPILGFSAILNAFAGVGGPVSNARNPRHRRRSLDQRSIIFIFAKVELG